MARTPRKGIVRASGKDGPQIIAATGHRWTDADEIVFLDTLSTTCNVKRSADASGFSTVAIYNRRRRDSGFAARWDIALDQGYARLEMLLVQRASESLEGWQPDPDTPIPPVSVHDATNILKLHRARIRGDGRMPGWRARPRSLEEVRDSILTKLDAIETARRDAGE